MRPPTSRTGTAAPVEDVERLIDEAIDRVSVDRLVETARRLIDVPSPTGAEGACAIELAERLDDHGVEATVDAFEADRANLVASVGRDDDGVGVVINGHLDTTGYGDDRDRAWLFEAGPTDTSRAIVADGVVAGLGAYNMKGGVAAAAEALIALSSVADRLPGTVTLAAVAGESEKAAVEGLLASFDGPAVAGGGIGTRRYLEGRRPDAAVICEPSGLAVVNAQPGYVLVRLLVQGRPSYLPPARTPTTVDAALAVAGAIRFWATRYADMAALDCGLGVLRPTATIGALEGGWPFKPSGTPAAVALYVDLRVPPHLDADGPLAELADVASAAAAALGPFTTTPTVFARHVPGAWIPADHPLIAWAQASVERATGAPSPSPGELDFVAGDDGKLFAAAGIPYVKLGPGSPGRRDPRYGREQVPIDELVASARAYVAIAARLASLPRTAIASWPAIDIASTHLARSTTTEPPRP
jgi:acetylornithine deacetylase